MARLLDRNLTAMEDNSGTGSGILFGKIILTEDVRNFVEEKEANDSSGGWKIADDFLTRADLAKLPQLC